MSTVNSTPILCEPHKQKCLEIQTDFQETLKINPERFLFPSSPESKIQLLSQHNANFNAQPEESPEAMNSLSQTKISEPDITDQDLIAIQTAADIFPFNLNTFNLQENIEFDNDYEEGIPEMKIFIAKVSGFSVAAAICSIILLFDLPVNLIYFLVISTMAYFFTVDLNWKFRLLGELLVDAEDFFWTVDEILVAVATLFMYLKYIKALNFSSLAIAAFVTSLVCYLINNKIPREKKIIGIATRIGYILQSLLISLRFDEHITWNWNLIFIPAWFCLIILAIRQTKTIFSLYKKIQKRFPTTSEQELSRKIGFVWYNTYSGSILMASAILFGMTSILNDQSNRTSLTTITIITTAFFSAFFVATIALRRRLIPFFLSYNLVTSHLLNYYALQPRSEPVREVEFETESKENYFVMVSSTYFQEINKTSPEKTDKMSEQRKDDESQCYLCFANPRNAILMGCGHGGICYECAIISVKKKNHCMECRKKVEGIYKIDPNPISSNTVKGFELTKVIVKEN